ncbi:DUF5829 family protein [Kordia sp.]|uniref:DUF5829 family protein n=1 Tax=Kordia sp. TaxID=1965332 RepID=UPI0025BCAB04|nr:DUF5829 family protein [Kordia sp.]MCH2193639.1 DUF5829 family protein [Kordia sp.]
MKTIAHIKNHLSAQKISFILGLFFFFSCSEKSKKTKTITVDYDKVDTFFGADVSQILFDHLYIVLDSVSYAKLTQNTFFKDTYVAIDKGFPNFETIDEKTASCYARGHKHYIEILGPNNQYQEPVGKSGIGFSLYNKGEHFHLGVKPKLKKNETTYLSISETVDVPLDQHEITWFKAFYSPSKNTNLNTWYAFYNPTFLDSLHQLKHQGYTREAFLQKSYKKECLFKDIKRISMDCTIDDYNRIAQEMRYLGCNLLNVENKVLTIASGDVLIRIRPSETIEYSRITEIQCRLNALDNSVIQLGNLTITNKGKESLWNFDNLNKTIN